MPFIIHTAFPAYDLRLPSGGIVSIPDYQGPFHMAYFCISSMCNGGCIYFIVFACLYKCACRVSKEVVACMHITD